MLWRNGFDGKVLRCGVGGGKADTSKLLSLRLSQESQTDSVRVVSNFYGRVASRSGIEAAGRPGALRRMSTRMPGG